MNRPNHPTTLLSIEAWHRQVTPNPDARALDVMMGVHFEEFEELVRSIRLDSAHEHLRSECSTLLKHLADSLKVGQAQVVNMHREEVLDALADGIVTAVGVGYRAGMNTPVAVGMVDLSNWSKFDENGRPIFNEHGKVMKGPGYMPPLLNGLY